MNVFDAAIDPDEPRLQRLMRELGSELYTLCHLDFSGENVPEEYHTIQAKSTIFRKANRDLVKGMIDAGNTDNEIKEYVSWFNSIERGSFRSTLLPLTEDVRLLFTREELSTFYKDRADTLLNIWDLTIRLSVDGRFAVDLIIKDSKDWVSSGATLNLKKVSEIE